MSRYKYTKLKNLGPVHGFFINTPDGRTIKDIYPEFIVRELNRLNDRIAHLIELGLETSEYGLQTHRELWEKEDKP